jgi:plastocyanin
MVERSFVMSRHAGFLAAIVAATVIGYTGTLGGAVSNISGTVTITGLASNANVLVYIQEAPGTFHPGASVEMDQRGMKFIPQLLPVVAGTTVRFLNSDPATHNVFSPDYEKYDLGTWQQGQTRDYIFPECAKPPCVYAQLCKIHAEMDAYIAVLQNPYFAISDKNGHYEIGNVPPGSYTLSAWYASRTRRYKAQPKPVTVDAGGPATVDLVLER